MAKRLVRIGPAVTKEFELDLSQLRPKGTVLIPIFRDYGLPRPAGAPRCLRRDLPHRYIFFEPLTLAALKPAKELENPEQAVQDLYQALESALANEGCLYYAGARLTWLELKELRYTPGNLLRLGLDRLRRRTPNFRNYAGDLYVQIQLDVLLGRPFN